MKWIGYPMRKGKDRKKILCSWQKYRSLGTKWTTGVRPFQEDFRFPWILNPNMMNLPEEDAQQTSQSLKIQSILQCKVPNRVKFFHSKPFKYLTKTTDRENPQKQSHRKLANSRLWRHATNNYKANPSKVYKS